MFDLINAFQNWFDHTAFNTAFGNFVDFTADLLSKTYIGQIILLGIIELFYPFMFLTLAPFALIDTLFGGF